MKGVCPFAPLPPVSVLNRKLIRNILHMKGQVIAICLVIACGVATFIMSLSTLEALRKNQAAYYDRYRFARVFAQLKRAPNSLAHRIAAIPGVARAQTRIVRDVTLDIPSLAEPAAGRLVSIRLVGTELARELPRAVAHLRVSEPTGPADLRIEAWDEAEVGGPAPPLREVPLERAAPGITSVSPDGRYVLFERPNTLFGLDRVARRLAEDRLLRPGPVQPLHFRASRGAVPREGGFGGGEARPLPLLLFRSFP